MGHRAFSYDRGQSRAPTSYERHRDHTALNRVPLTARSDEDLEADAGMTPCAGLLDRPSDETKLVPNWDEDRDAEQELRLTGESRGRSSDLRLSPKLRTSARRYGGRHPRSGGIKCPALQRPEQASPTKNAARRSFATRMVSASPGLHRLRPHGLTVFDDRKNPFCDNLNPDRDDLARKSTRIQNAFV